MEKIFHACVDCVNDLANNYFIGEEIFQKMF